MLRHYPVLFVVFLCSLTLTAQVPDSIPQGFDQGLRWRNIGPFRGGRSVAITGVPGNNQRYYMGSTGGGIWKTDDAGLSWTNISDGQLASGSVGAIAVAPSDPNVLYVGMGEHPVRGVMTSAGDGMYKSADAGKSWTHIGLPGSQHIAEIRIHPQNPEHVYVAVQGALYGPSEDRGVYVTRDGGASWEKILYVNEHAGAADLSMDPHNPRILYAGMWDHQRTPWTVRSGGPGSGIHKSTDGGATWTKLGGGLPDSLGKVAVDVSAADPNVVYANIEAENGGVYRSNDGGATWRQTTDDRITRARAWYYTEIFADPVDPETVYVLNAPMLKSIDGGKSFSPIANPHGDQHHMWINPDAPQNIALANDGGGTITFNGGKTWSPQSNQPTAQFYRVITDARFPYYLYAGQQDNSTVAIPNRTRNRGIGDKDWYAVAGCESAFLAFDPQDPETVYGGCYQGIIEAYDQETGNNKDIMAYSTLGLSAIPREMTYRFNWNAPIVAKPQNPEVIYHAGNVVLRTEDGGLSWTEISPDLTRNDETKQGPGGGPFIIEGAGGENYNTISYLAASPHEAGTLWVGTDDGLVHVTRNEGDSWTEVTPSGLQESLINSIEISPHDPATAYVVATRYKFNDPRPYVFRTTDYGQSWTSITDGLADTHFMRVVREDPVREGLLYGGAEAGFYLSFDQGDHWHAYQLNLPVCPITDLAFRDNDLVAATSGRAFWILDDLGPLQQYEGSGAVEQALLFQPKPAYRFGPADVRSAPAGLGQNAPGGITLYYALPEDVDSSSTIKLEMLDAAGEVLRTYDTEKDSTYTDYPGGPPRKASLPAGAGLQRFTWDLRREPVVGVPGVFVLGDYGGARVPPGEYTARLIVGPDTLSRSCTLLADPRLPFGDRDFARQQAEIMQLQDAVHDIHRSVNQMREVREQIDFLRRRATSSGANDLAKQARDLMDKIDSWEQHLIQPKQETFQDVINFPNQLNAKMLTLIERMDGDDPRLTEGALRRKADLLDEWEEQQRAMNTLTGEDIPAFQEAFKARNLPLIALPDANSTSTPTEGS